MEKAEKEEEEVEKEKKEEEEVRWKLASFFYSLVRNILESCPFE